jgi:uncharacterized protein (TIGR03083 family)
MTNTISQKDLRDFIAAERREFAAVLAALPPESWDVPSLCAGWRVREVVAHMTMPFRYPPHRSGQQLAASGGDFTAMSDRCAKADAAAMSAAELAAAVADNEHNPWQPPGDPAAPLTHDTIHGLDVTEPLGLSRPIPADRMKLVLDTVISAQALGHFGVDLTGIELVADDLDWSAGSGDRVIAPARHLLLAIAGRHLPDVRLNP